MRRFRVLLSIVIVLLGTVLLGVQPRVFAQEATPAAEEFAPEGISFEPLAFAPGLALPATSDLSLIRVGFDPGAGFPSEEGDPTYALVVVESGELTVRLEGTLVVTRAGAFEAAMAEAETGGAFAPATEQIPAGQEVTLQPGDTVLFPPLVAGEIRNAGQERTVVIAVLVAPPFAEATPTAGTPTP